MAFIAISQQLARPLKPLLCCKAITRQSFAVKVQSMQVNRKNILHRSSHFIIINAYIFIHQSDSYLLFFPFVDAMKRGKNGTAITTDSFSLLILPFVSQLLPFVWCNATIAVQFLSLNRQLFLRQSARSTIGIAKVGYDLFKQTC